VCGDDIHVVSIGLVSEESFVSSVGFLEMVLESQELVFIFVVCGSKERLVLSLGRV